MHSHRLCSLLLFLLLLPGVQLPGLKASSDRAWPRNLGSDSWRIAKVREGAERHLVQDLCPLAWELHLNSSLGRCLSYSVGLPVPGTAPCSSWLSCANPDIVPASSLQTGLDRPGPLTYLVTVAGPALLTLLPPLPCSFPGPVEQLRTGALWKS